MGSKGIVASSAAMGMLLQMGIGDTIRYSLTPEPGGDRTLEVRAAQELLQTMGLRVVRADRGGVPRLRAHDVHGVPGAGARRAGDDPRAHAGVAHEYPGVETLNLAVMGCIVNGPGESKHADIGISLPGTGEQPAAPVFIDGKKAMTLRGPNIAAEFQQIVEDYIDKRYGAARKEPVAATP